MRPAESHAIERMLARFVAPEQHPRRVLRAGHRLRERAEIVWALFREREEEDVGELAPAPPTDGLTQGGGDCRAGCELDCQQRIRRDGRGLPHETQRAENVSLDGRVGHG